jgi:hypothetical protein
MYKKYYDLKELKDTIAGLTLKGRHKINLEQLLNEIGCDTLDFQEYYVKNIKHIIRYERER